MANINDRHTEATRRVMKALARLVAREPLPVKLEDGTSPVVVAVPEEPVADMLARISRAGGRANVAIDYVDHFAIAACESKSLGEAIDSATSDHAEVHQLSTVGMLMTWIATQPNGSGAFTMTGPVDTVPPVPRVREHEYQF